MLLVTGPPVYFTRVKSMILLPAPLYCFHILYNVFSQSKNLQLPAHDTVSFQQEWRKERLVGSRRGSLSSIVHQTKAGGRMLENKNAS